MGFVSKPGPPKLSSPEVAHQLDYIFNEDLHDFETGWLSALAQRNPELMPCLAKQKERQAEIKATRNPRTSIVSNMDMSPRLPFNTVNGQNNDSSPALAQQALAGNPAFARTQSGNSIEYLRNIAKMPVDQVRNMNLSSDQLQLVNQLKQQNSLGLQRLQNPSDQQQQQQVLQTQPTGHINLTLPGVAVTPSQQSMDQPGSGSSAPPGRPSPENYQTALAVLTHLVKYNRSFGLESMSLSSFFRAQPAR